MYRAKVHLAKHAKSPFILIEHGYLSGFPLQGVEILVAKMLGIFVWCPGAGRLI
jgi:hypothetical protein